MKRRREAFYKFDIAFTSPFFFVAAFNRFVKCWYTRVLNRCSVPDFDCNTIKMSSKATVWGNIWNGILRAQKSSLTTKYGTLGIRIIFHLTMLSLFIPSICQISWYLMKLVKSEHILKLKFYDTFLEYQWNDEIRRFWTQHKIFYKLKCKVYSAIYKII